MTRTWRSVRGLLSSVRGFPSPLRGGVRGGGNPYGGGSAIPPHPVPPPRGGRERRLLSRIPCPFPIAGLLPMTRRRLPVRGFPSPLWGGVRGGGNPYGGGSAIPPTLSLP